MSAEIMIRDFCREFPGIKFTRDQELRLIEMVREETDENSEQDWMCGSPEDATPAFEEAPLYVEP